MGGYFSLILGFWKCLTLEVGKTTFFQESVPIVVSEIKYIKFSVTIGGGGVWPKCNICYIFLKPSLKTYVESINPDYRGAETKKTFFLSHKTCLI